MAKPPWLDSMVERVCFHLTHAKHPLIESDILDSLEKNLEYAYPILDELLKESAKVEEDNHIKQHCYLLLLCEILSFLSYAVEQGRDWAVGFSKELQSYIATHAFRPEVSPHILQNLLDILHQAEITIETPIREAHAKLMRNNTPQTPVASETIIELLEDIAVTGSGSEFDMYNHLVNQTHQVSPIDVQLIMISQMILAENDLVKNTSILMLMHPEPIIREHTANLLLENIDSVTPRSLRRLIVMRNWLPSDERNEVDAIIRLARMTGVDCEPWPEATVLKILATGFDNVGAQSILALSKQNQLFHLGGVLLKEKTGLKEPLLFCTEQKQESQKIMAEMSVESSCIRVKQDYLDMAVPHYISLNLSEGNPPSPLLINFAEIMGISHWRSESIEPDHMLQRLLATLPSEHATTLTDKSLKQSAAWLQSKAFAQTWYKLDARSEHMTRQLIASVAPEYLTEAICRRVFEPMRTVWYERFIWMTLWMMHSVSNNSSWQVFLGLSKLMKDNVAMEKIAFIRSLAHQAAQMLKEQQARHYPRYKF